VYELRTKTAAVVRDERVVAELLGGGEVLLHTGQHSVDRRGGRLVLGERVAVLAFANALSA
jgi:hypothetical protein